MKKILILLITLAAVGAVAWKFFPEATKEIADKAKQEAEAIRARVMAKHGVELHSDAKPLTVEAPKLDDIHYHAWYMKEYDYSFIMDDKYKYDTSLGNASPYRTHKSSSDMTEDPNGSAFTSDAMAGVWEVVKIENDVLTFKWGAGQTATAERLKGEKAKAVQAIFDAWKKTHSDATP